MNERFPFPRPYGWFAVGRLDELPDGAVTAVRAQGTDLVVWRDDATDDPATAWRVFDAYCPHLGAHLGVGGRVDDGCLVCPFHEWSFRADGTNAAIPYADRPNRKARVRAYPTVVRNGHLLFWWHPDPDVDPMWEVPQALGPEHAEVGRFTWTVRTAWQEIAENSVDMAHFQSVHGLEPGQSASARSRWTGRSAGSAACSCSTRPGARSRVLSRPPATGRAWASSTST